MGLIKRELLKSVTFEYLHFLRISKMYTEGEKKERIAALNTIKETLTTTMGEDELDNALYWTTSNFTASLQGLGVSSVPHMISFTASLLQDDRDWQKRYSQFYEMKSAES